jgi:hypothetical protein
MAGYLISLDRHFAPLSIIFLWGFFITVAIGFVIDFRRYQGKRRLAFWGGGAVILMGSGLCAYLFLWIGIMRPPHFKMTTSRVKTPSSQDGPVSPENLRDCMVHVLEVSNPNWIALGNMHLYTQLPEAVLSATHSASVNYSVLCEPIVDADPLDIQGLPTNGPNI